MKEVCVRDFESNTFETKARTQLPVIVTISKLYFQKCPTLIKIFLNLAVQNYSM